MAHYSATHAGASAINPVALDQAAEWLVLLHGGQATEADRQQCRQWQGASADNARAWARAETLMNKLGTLPPALAMPVLQRSTAPARRAALAKLAGLLAALPAAWFGWQALRQSDLAADHHTGTGQRRTIRLADGSQVILNSASAIDVVFDQDRRLVRLRHGEIMITTAADTAASARPFLVETAEGMLQALGTRFAVHQQTAHTQLDVFESAVRVAPRRLPASARVTIAAGQRLRFSADAIDAPQPLSVAADAWTQGMLVADNMRLDAFSAELARYLPGLLRCEDEVADLRISGTFPLDQPQQILTMLVSTYPIEARRRFGGYWVTLSAPGPQ
ncbi:FecR domain-containing protein [Herbaspirillum sp. alder98]|uniref:FecR domain-containing protein n=1 Tax=Herbaspirillum sp. alder98 TaxID=2913096 RepID=UPI001CD8D32E|nr:FecR family protein [Herbaspirillum sp. alder98]MCA1323625.1 FecR family protein [Herbaspirillum sp. alder98]